MTIRQLAAVLVLTAGCAQHAAPRPIAVGTVRPVGAIPPSSPPRPLASLTWRLGDPASPWTPGSAARALGTIGPKGTRLYETGTPPPGAPTTVVDHFIDADASAIVQRAVVLHDCKSPPVVPAGYTASGGSRDYSVGGPALPSLIDATGETSPVLALELIAQFSCAEPWAAWLALPLDAAIRDARAATSFRVYVDIDQGIKGYAYRLAPEVVQAATDFLGAGKRLAELWGDIHTGFSPTKPATQAFHVRMAASGPLECTVSAGRSGGVDLSYARVLGGDRDRRFFVSATDRPVLIFSNLEAFPHAPGAVTSLEISMPPDTSCSADLVPKVADTMVAALRLGVPRGLLEEEGAVDFRTESVVVFATPTAMQRLEPGAPPTVTITIPQRGPACPGGLPPKYEPKPVPPPPPPQKAEPQPISGDSLAIAYVIRRGSPPPTKVFIQTPAPRCLPMP